MTLIMILKRMYSFGTSGYLITWYFFKKQLEGEMLPFNFFNMWGVGESPRFTLSVMGLGAFLF